MALSLATRAQAAPRGQAARAQRPAPALAGLVARPAGLVAHRQASSVVARMLGGGGGEPGGRRPRARARAPRAAPPAGGHGAPRAGGRGIARAAARGAGPAAQRALPASPNQLPARAQPPRRPARDLPPLPNPPIPSPPPPPIHHPQAPRTRSSSPATRSPRSEPRSGPGGREGPAPALSLHSQHACLGRPARARRADTRRASYSTASNST
jgi:hypothetical protein